MKLTALALLSATVAAQFPIPAPSSDGLLLGKKTATVQLDAFFDLMCPDSRAAWPNLQKVIRAYSEDDVALTLHWFPLPYHHASYFANMGAHIVNDRNASATVNWVDAVFANQEAFGNAPLADMTFNQVIAKFAQLAQSATGLDAASFAKALNNPSFDWITRVSWKYGVSRAIPGTPAFLINQVPLQGSSSWDLADWQKVIDPILQTTPPTPYASLQALNALNPSASKCPSDKPACEYLPGKVECCLKGEFCIPNVGCRC